MNVLRPDGSEIVALFSTIDKNVLTEKTELLARISTILSEFAIRKGSTSMLAYGCFGEFQTSNNELVSSILPFLRI